MRESLLKFNVGAIRFLQLAVNARSLGWWGSLMLEMIIRVRFVEPHVCGRIHRCETRLDPHHCHSARKKVPDVNQ